MNCIDQKLCRIDRRRFLAVFSSLGLASTLLPGALAAASQGQDTITTQIMISVVFNRCDGQIQ